jgi:hypothetical protein
VTELWTMTVMPNGVLVPPLPHPPVPLAPPAIVQWRKETDVEMK